MFERVHLETILWQHKSLAVLGNVSLILRFSHRGADWCSSFLEISSSVLHPSDPQSPYHSLRAFLVLSFDDAAAEGCAEPAISPYSTTMERGGVDANTQIFQICCSDAEEKEEKRNVGRHRSFASVVLPHCHRTAHPFSGCLCQMLCPGLAGSCRQPEKYWANRSNPPGLTGWLDRPEHNSEALPQRDNRVYFPLTRVGNKS